MSDMHRGRVSGRKEKGKAGREGGRVDEKRRGNKAVTFSVNE